MALKETATATVEKFFELLGCKAPILDAWETHGFIDGIACDYQDRYTIAALSFKDTLNVSVYDFVEDARRDDILRVGKIGPELAAKFTREAITAYEQELGK